jgi:hypothetical protein
MAPGSTRPLRPTSSRGYSGAGKLHRRFARARPRDGAGLFLNQPGVSPTSMNDLGKIIGGFLLDVRIETASDDSTDMLRASDWPDRAGLARPIASWQSWMNTIHHEAGHAVAALIGGGTHIEVLVREDASGLCSHRDGSIVKPEDIVTFTLAGMAAGARFNPSSIHAHADGCYDLMAARQLIAAINACGKWPHLTCENAAKKAVQVVDANWRAIENCALALSDCGELDDFGVRFFSGAR